MLKFLIFFFNFGLILLFCVPSADGKFQDNFKSLLEENLPIKFYEFINENKFNYLSEKLTASEKDCVNQLSQVALGLKNTEIWAIEMIDSWGKIPAGILRGHMKELGNFEECVNIKTSTSTEDYLKGQYCTLNLPVKKILDGLPKPNGTRVNSGALLEQLFLQFGICVPNLCSGKILDKLLKDMLSERGIKLPNDTILINEQSCKNNEPLSKNAMFYVAIVLLAIFGIVMLLSTIYDYIICRSGREPASILLTAFSIKSNGKRLFRIEDYSNSPNVIQCLNGIRCLSIIMVVYGHEYGFAFILNFINPIAIREWEKTAYSFIIKNGTLAVDTFFVLSGCLLIWAAFKEMEKTNGRLNIPLMYFHRYIRLTPVVAMAIIISIGILPHLGNGPFWDLNMYLPPCEKYWWTTLLYVQNYVNPDNICLPHTWYLAVDTQFYILSPLLIIPMYKWGIIGIIPGVLGSIGSIVYVLITWLNKEYHVFLQEKTNIDTDRERLIYITTHSRIPSYVVGIALGYILFKTRTMTIKLSKLIIGLAWLASFAIMAAIIFGLYPKAQNLPNPSGVTPIEGALFESLSRVSWSIAVAWIIFACHKGFGGVINTFLSWGMWQPLARISYSIYVTHALVTMLIIIVTKNDVHFSDYDMMIRFWATFGFTVILSVIFVLAFELPILGIEKAIFSKKSKKSI